MDFFMNESRPHTGLTLIVALTLAIGSFHEGFAQEAEVDREAVKTPHLGLGVPADCIAYLHLKPSSGWSAFGKDVKTLFSEVTAEGLVSWLLDMFPVAAENQLDEKAQKDRADSVRGEVAHWVDVFASVEWRRLISNECAVGLRYEFLDTELVALFRVDPADRAQLSGQLTRVLEEIAARGGDFEMLDSTRLGIATVVVQSRTDPRAQICVGGLADVVAVATSSTLLRQSLRLLAGEAHSTPMVLGAPYERILNKDDKAQRDFELFVRPAKYFDNLREELKAIEDAIADVDETELPETIKIARVRGRRMVNGLDLVDGVSLRASLAGNKILSHFALQLRERNDKADGSSAAHLGDSLFPDRTLAKRGSFARIGAAGVLAWTGFEYRSLVSGISEIFGGDKIEGDLQGELLGLFDGEVFLAGRTTETPPVLFVEIRDAKEATATLKKAIGRVEANPGELPFVHRVRELDSADGFRVAFSFADGKKEELQLGVQDNFVFLTEPGQVEFAVAAARARASGADAPEGLHGVWDLDIATLVQWVAVLGGSQRGEPVSEAVIRGLKFLGRLSGNATRSGSRYEGKATLKLKLKKRQF